MTSLEMTRDIFLSLVLTIHKTPLQLILYQNSAQYSNDNIVTLIGHAGHETRQDRAILPRRDKGYYWLSAVTALAAVRPETKISTMALPPRRLPPWMPPVTSPAA